MSGKLSQHVTAVVLKVASRCNLDCTYCYMFNSADRSYRDQPALMGLNVADAVIAKVSRHCAEHAIPHFSYIFHGGEPLLARDDFFTRFVSEARRQTPSETRLTFLLQTNGVLLNEDRCKTLSDLGIRLGISIDGPQHLNDRSRVDHQGQGSYRAALAGWRVAASMGAKPGLLAVIDPRQDVEEAYSHLKQLQPRKADFLFPDATHDSPVLRPDSKSTTPYGDWLLSLFNLWINDKERDFEIRFFVDIIKLLLLQHPEDGSPKRGYNGTIFIEPDGLIETLDLLRACEDGMAKTALNILSCELDDVFADPLVNLYYHAHERLCDDCKKCSISSVCGGGELAHRYSTKRRFDNPSVYCADLKKVIKGVRSWAIDTLDEERKLPSDPGHGDHIALATRVLKNESR